MSSLALLDPTSFVTSSGYAAIFVLSVLQSCCVPTSSELTLGFGGVLASQGTLSLPGVIAAGTAGEVVGAFIAWAVGRAGGRPLVERYGRFVLLSPHDLDRVEAWYGRHERWGVLGSRLLPVIRNFVAVPAGVARVPALRFGILTAIGSLVWDGAMALIGYGIGGQWKSIMKGFSDAGYLLGALAVLAIALLVWHRWRSYNSAVRGDRAAMGRGADVEDLRRPSDTSAVDERAGDWRATSTAAGVPAREAPRGAPRHLSRTRNNAAQALKVPVRITALFWAVKLLSTAMGESLSDALVHGINQYLAVVIGFIGFAVAMAFQLSARRYSAWTYWSAVAMVAVFGTMAADVLHLGLHVPYAASSIFYLVALIVILTVWYRTEGTLSIHSIYTPRREIFYWLTVLATFALGTAAGDLTATTFKLGYLGSGVMFAALFAVPGLAYGLMRANAVATFWLAYILTRPLGASFADWLGFAHNAGGIGVGHALTALLFAIPIVVLVAYLAASKLDTPEAAGRLRAHSTRSEAAINEGLEPQGLD
ncbi:MAG: putative rane-anchored protein [Acidimicrobiaceae bacterium]|nr:putative rane-anchored protein [Acidimicrobiaceae bacterium]